jgi:hypothetical protein
MAAQSKHSRKTKVRHTIQTRHVGFRSYAWFNRFEIHSGNDGKLVYFGLVIGSRSVSQVAVLISGRLLAENKEANLSYLERLNVPPLGEAEIANIGQWRPEIRDSEVFVPSLMRMGYAENEAEISFYGLAFSALIGLENGSEFESDPLVALKSRIEIQRFLIENLYVED